jgi:hypothetical protein
VLADLVDRRVPPLHAHPRVLKESIEHVAPDEVTAAKNDDTFHRGVAFA